jgi:polyisoprenoid-binding protein YceI
VPGPAIAATQYILDKSASRFSVRAFASGMLAAMGHNPTIAIRDFTGELHFDPAAPKDASLSMQIRADSLEVTDEIKRKDRLEIESNMRQKVLETSKFPVIFFASTQASADQLGEGRYRVALHGNLSLHGVTGPLQIITQLTMLGDMLRASGEFTILQSSYGIARISVGGGALTLKDELKFSFDMVARKQE